MEQDKPPKNRAGGSEKRFVRPARDGEKRHGNRDFRKADKPRFANPSKGAKPRGAGRRTERGPMREPGEPYFLYGIHTVKAALENPNRTAVRLHATLNGLNRLELSDERLATLEVVDALPKNCDHLVGRDAVHQGVVLEVIPLEPKPIAELGDETLVLVLDQVTDPHNVGAIMRSAVAMGATSIITTARHSAPESGVLAKAASGALDMINTIQVGNLAKAMGDLHAAGFQTVGLDSEGPDILENSLSRGRIALVLGAEGKGLRQKTRETCHVLARLDMPGAIKSLNVSNAAALSLYLVQRHQVALSRG